MPEFVIALGGLGFGLGLTAVAVGLTGPGPHPVPVFRRAPRTSRRVGKAERVRGLLAAVVGAVVWLVTGWPVAGVALAALVVFLPWLFAAGRISAQRVERLEAIEDWLRGLADALGPGTTGLVSALQNSARDVPAVIAGEVTTLAQRLRTWDVQDALLAFAEDIDDQVGDTAAAGLCVAYQQGAGVAELLKILAGQIADEVTARRAAEADRARRRSTARVLLILWGLMFTGFALFGSATYTGVYRTVPGQIVLALVLGMVAVALIWLRRLGLEPRAPRFLTTTLRRERP